MEDVRDCIEGDLCRDKEAILITLLGELFPNLWDDDPLLQEFDVRGILCLVDVVGVQVGYLLGDEKVTILLQDERLRKQHRSKHLMALDVGVLDSHHKEVGRQLKRDTILEVDGNLLSESVICSHPCNHILGTRLYNWNSTDRP